MKIIEQDGYKIVKLIVTLDVIVGYHDETYFETPEVIYGLERMTSNDVGRLVKSSLGTAKILDDSCQK